jgi:hypothetical protein
VARSRRKNKLQVADSHWPALYNVQACFGQKRDEVMEIDITVVVKMIEKSVLSLSRPCEVNG